MNNETYSRSETISFTDMQRVSAYLGVLASCSASPGYASNGGLHGHGDKSKREERKRQRQAKKRGRR